MKKIIRSSSTMVLFILVCTLMACKKNPVDKQLDNFETMMTKIDKAFHEQNPTAEEISAFKKDLAAFHESFMAFRQSTVLDHQLSDAQKQRFLKIIHTGQSILYFPIHEDLRQMATQYNLKY